MIVHALVSVPVRDIFGVGVLIKIESGGIGAPSAIVSLTGT